MRGGVGRRVCGRLRMCRWASWSGCGLQYDDEEGKSVLTWRGVRSFLGQAGRDSTAASAGLRQEIEGELHVQDTRFKAL